MNRRLLWKFCVIIATGIVAMYYLLNALAIQTEENLSMLEPEHRQELRAWGKQVQALFEAGDKQALQHWLQDMQSRENTWAAIVKFDTEQLFGEPGHEHLYLGSNLGRSIDWKIHLYMDHNPVMEIKFDGRPISLLVQLPERMRPGSYWPTVKLLLQVFLPMLLLALLSVLLYRHIMNPLHELEHATQAFSRGDFSIRVRRRLGSRNDEISELANTFDQMAGRIGDLIISQRQLIADLSHELRTPLTRLDIAVANVRSELPANQNLERIERESGHIRRLVEDTLTLAWLDNERPDLKSEEIELVDLIDVIVDDAKYEFPAREINTKLPRSAPLLQSNHRAIGQALENVLRNALKYSPHNSPVDIELELRAGEYQILVLDRGPGVPQHALESIFQPFFQMDQARSDGKADGKGFGLGLALARRQLKSVGGYITAQNREQGGLRLQIVLPLAASQSSANLAAMST